MLEPGLGFEKCPAEVQRVIDTLQNAGFEAYLVGGCVRDTLLGREPNDWDVTTSALPEETLEVFREFRTIPTGLRHGTVTVLAARGISVEVTTYRVDGTYSDSRRPDSVTFTRTLAEDLSRRDFTINAMAYSDRDGLVDLFGGREDLAARSIRAVGDPATRFGEDALRMLRAVRFSVQLKCKIEEKTYAALGTCCAGLAQISAERIRDEVEKILVCPDAARGVETLFDTGLAAYVFPGLSREALPNLKMLDVFLPPEPELRLAYLLSGVPDATAVAILRSLKPSGAFSGAVRKLREARLPSGCDARAARRFRAEFGDLTEFALLYAAAKEGDFETADTLWGLAREAADLGDCTSREDLAIHGGDLVAVGIPPSPALGRVMERLFQAVLDDPEKNRRETLLDLGIAYYSEEAKTD